MKNKALLIALAILAVAAGVVIHRKMDERTSRISPNATHSNSHSATHSASASPSRVPSYQSVFEAQTLNLTLAPAQFVDQILGIFPCSYLPSSGEASTDSQLSLLQH